VKNGANITLNNAREGKVKASLEYAKNNVKEAKAATDKVKDAKKEMVGADGKEGYHKDIEQSRDRIFKYYDDFLKAVGLPSRTLRKVLALGVKYYQEIEEAYLNIVEIYEELESISEDLKNTGSEEAKSLIDKIDPIIALKNFAYGNSQKGLELKQELTNYYEAENLREAQKTLDKIKIVNKEILGYGKSEFNLKRAKKIKEIVNKEYDKFMIKNKKTPSLEEQQEEKIETDAWPVSKDIENHERLFGEESQSEGHIPIPMPLNEKAETQKHDSWNIIDKNEKDLFEYRKDDMIAKIKNTLATTIDISGSKDIKRSSYQQIYFYYDAEQLQRFYLLTSSDKLFKIKNIKISKQLAYMLGFTECNDGFIEKNSFGKYSPDVSGGLHSFYVYCPNLIANTIIGNQYGPLLRVVNVDLETKNKVVETIYTQEFHHKILLKQIPEIAIKILSDTGQPIEFNWGNCIITLHFKRAIF
jgi:hypothetical protein